MRKILTIFVLLLSSASTMAAGVAATGVKLDPAMSRQNLNAWGAKQSAKGSLTKQLASNRGSKMDGFLLRLRSQQAEMAKTPSGAALPQDADTRRVAHPFLRFSDTREVQVYVQLSDTAQTTLDNLEAVGLRIELVNQLLVKIQGWIAVDQLMALAAVSNVELISAPRYANLRAGSVMTQGDAIIKANQLRSMGFTGKGVRVGIISDGANNWTQSRARGDLPASDIATYGRCTPNSANPAACLYARSCNEGTAMAEIIHDIAPDATLAVGAASTSLEFIQRVNELYNDFKADIIVDDLGYFGEPYFEDGDIAKVVAGAASQLLFISAAGNSGDSHYEQQYRQTSGSSLHDFGWAEGRTSDIDQGIVVPAKTSLVVIMQWNDPFNASYNDYDLMLWDGYNIVRSSEDPQTGSGSTPIEGFCYYNSSNADHVRWLEVKKFDGQGKRLELFFLGRGAHEYSHPNGSVFGHAGLPSVLTAGAINARDPGNDNIAFYSSRGPARIDYPAIANRRKPDMVGIDGVNVTGVGGFDSPFYGTSAAAPHAAGVAALLMSTSPGANVKNVVTAIREGAKDLGAAEFDYTYGYGRLDAAKALELLKIGTAIPAVLYLLLHQD